MENNMNAFSVDEKSQTYCHYKKSVINLALFQAEMGKFDEIFLYI
jgi:hypothetical protein